MEIDKKYCCERFEESVNAKEIIHADDNDETEWFLPGLWHLYYCPFCGAFIKGSGWGKYQNEHSPRKGKASSCK
jgi:hypothetical protein